MRASFLLSLALCLTGCSDPEPAPVAETPTVPSHLFTGTRPADVQDLMAVKATAAKGDTVTFLARVGGRVRPFNKTQAIFVVADPAMQSCEIIADDDHCKLPWDYCCEDPDALKQHLASVRLLNDGKPIRTNAKGAGGLEELKFVVVTGVVTDMNDDGLFAVDATQIWVGGKPIYGQPRLGS